LGFAGLLYDPGAGIYLAGARAYDPALGRFLQSDPLRRVPFGSQKDFSQYVYCGNDPLNFADRDGASPLKSRLGKKLVEAYDWFTHKAQETAEYDAAIVADPNNSWLIKAAVSVPGVLAASFTPETAPKSYAWMKPALVYSGVEPALKAAYYAGVAADPNEDFSESLNAATEFAEYATTELALSAAKSFAAEASLLSESETFRNYAKAFKWSGRADDVEIAATALELTDKAKDTVELADFYFGAERDATKLRVEAGDAQIVMNENAPERPADVGGVYLAGAGPALAHLGKLKGIALGDNGQLILLSEDAGTLSLPPLRLDDVVTIFRCVYQDGEAPWVTIDPDYRSSKAAHTVRLSRGAQDTYVGWVLFETDRVMKSYCLGCDNITKAPITSRVPGYQSGLSRWFEHYDEEVERRKPYDDKLWWRNWFVPALVARSESASGQLAMIEVPLKLKNEIEVVRENKPSPAGFDLPSYKGFADWFTAHYDEIASEVLAVPPPESGLDGHVPVFHELKRIAVVCGIAEALRDRGVPFPSWMLDYHVRPCPVPRTTPAGEVSAQERHGGGTITLSQHGGVVLSPEDEAIQVSRGAPAAEAAALTVHKATFGKLPLATVTVADAHKTYRATLLPGADTRDVFACRLAESDLVVPIREGFNIRLVRYANSFFDPPSSFGKVWTLDVPKLENWKYVTERHGDKTLYHTYWQLVSPLGTVSEAFDEIKLVPEVNSKLATPRHVGSYLGLTGATNEERIGVETTRLLLRNGEKWHFTEDGLCVGRQHGPRLVVYRRQPQRRLIERIEGWYGSVKHAEILLSYDSQDHIETATGKGLSGANETVSYTYSEDGTLATVKGSQHTRAYNYRGTLVTEILEDGMVQRQFEYADRGQLRRERLADGTVVNYDARLGPQGLQTTTAVNHPAGASPVASNIEYDASFRPVKEKRPDGTHIERAYDDSGTEVVTVTTPTSRRYVQTRSADGTQRTLKTPEGGELQVECDHSGRMVSLERSGVSVLTREWTQDGQLRSATFETSRIHHEYGEDGLATRTLITEPQADADGKYTRWLEAKYDSAGRLMKLADGDGAGVELRYDPQGQLVAWQSKAGSVEWKRSADGKTIAYEASWGDRVRTYKNDDASLARIELAQGEQQATVVFDKGLLTSMKQIDGRQLVVSYFDSGRLAGLVREVRTPNGVTLTYEYDSQRRLVVVNCGNRYRLQYAYDAAGRLIRYMMQPTKAA
jgi:RHS repeat-associated protein